MISDIILSSYTEANSFQHIYKKYIVVACLFKSLDEFSQNIVYRMMSNGGTILREQILALMQTELSSVHLLDETIKKLTSLRIVSIQSVGQKIIYVLDKNFGEKLE